MKSKKIISIITLFAFLSFIFVTPNQAYGWWWSSDPNNKDLTFETVYPTPFWSTTTGTILKYTGLAIIVFTITYFTAGGGTAASAGVIAKFIGAQVGSWVYGLAGGAAINAGLALLGGGTVAAGGLGILGGISVISAVGSLAMTAAVDAAMGQVPAGTHNQSIALMRPRLFFDLVSPVVKDDLNELKSTLEEISEKGGTDSQAQKVTQLLEKIDSKLWNEIRGKVYAGKEADDYTAYNCLLLAVIRYNLRKYDEAKRVIQTGRKYVNPEKSSVLDYVEALIALMEEDEVKGVALLRKIIEKEPKISTPYIVLGQLAFDKENYFEAFDILEKGLNNTNDEVCVMSWMAGNSLYNAKRYEKAIDFYKKALSNMTINEYEALYKLNIAKCYKKLGNNKDGLYWLDDAISEVKDNSKMVNELREQYGF